MRIDGSNVCLIVKIGLVIDFGLCLLLINLLLLFLEMELRIGVCLGYYILEYGVCNRICDSFRISMTDSIYYCTIARNNFTYELY